MPSPRYWREIPSRFRLEAARCRQCGQVSYPVRWYCPACRSEKLEMTELTRRGKVITSTVIHVPPDGLLMEAPYAVALIETPEGARLMTQVVDCDPSDVVQGFEVSLEFRLVHNEGKGGIRCYGHKGVPVA